MNIVLVSAHTHPVALGLRYISSALKAAGHNVKVLFMSSRKPTTQADYPPAVQEAFLDHCRTADLIGISLMTGNFDRACTLTEWIRGAGIRAPILWGGTHPTIAPDECLEVADIICVGEGEKPVTDLAACLAAGGNPTAIGSLGFRAGGPFGNAQRILNCVQPLITDLDSIPFPDYELATHWIVEKGQLVQATPANLRGTLTRLRLLSTRGCPNPCSFCNNTTLMRIHKDAGPWVRRRSVDNVLAEMVQTVQAFPSIEEINIVDDLFFIRDEAEMQEFVEKYLAQVNLPLELDAHPNTITEGKVACLSRLPISLMSMGIQSASPDTLKNVYNRPTPVENIARAIGIFHKYRLPTEYHYIINNPYEPDANVIQTMRFIADHHRKAAVLRVFPLQFYPGSPLYERARKDGVIGARHEETYKVIYTSNLQLAGHNYLSVWLHAVLGLRNIGGPSWMAHALISFVTCRPVRWCLDRRYFTPAAFLTYQVTRRVFKPFARLARLLRRKPRRRARSRAEELTLPRNNLMAGAR